MDRSDVTKREKGGRRPPRISEAREPNQHPATALSSSVSFVDLDPAAHSNADLGDLETINATATQPKKFDGYVDGLDPKWRIRGWIRPLVPGVERACVSLCEGDRTLSSDTADRYRGDLLEAGIGNGNFGYLLTIPSALFDGLRHTLTIRVDNLISREDAGRLELFLPQKIPIKAQAGSSGESRTSFLKSIFGARAASADAGQATEIARVLDQIANKYDIATALGLLYMHVLRRSIDPLGLGPRLTRLSERPEDMELIVREILSSEEAVSLFRDTHGISLPSISALKSWCNDFRPTPAQA